LVPYEGNDSWKGHPDNLSRIREISEKRSHYCKSDFFTEFSIMTGGTQSCNESEGFLG